MACPMETTEAFCDGHVSAFSFLGVSQGTSCTTTLVWRQWQVSWDPPREYFHPPLTSRQFRPKKRAHLRVTAARTA